MSWRPFSGRPAWAGLQRLGQRLLPSGSGGMPRRVARRIAALGPVIDTQASARICAPLHGREPYAGVHVARDLRYGPHARNLLDVFTPTGPATASRPVLMFVHGGGFFGGGRRTPSDDSPFYDNVMLLAAGAGLVGVNVAYRLVPGHAWPAGAEDVGAAVRWIGERVADHGGDPARIVLMGHSAGATHVAGYLAHPQLHGPGGPGAPGVRGVRGAILVSGLYDLAGRELFQGERAYFGDDPARHAERAALPRLAETDVPLLLVHAELDPPVFHAQAARLGSALAAKGRAFRAMVLAGHNHLSEMFALNTADTSFSSEILTFVGETTATWPTSSQF